MLIQKDHKKAALHDKKTELGVIKMGVTRSAVRKIPAYSQSAYSNYLLPPQDSFNTGYLKPKKHDPL